MSGLDVAETLDDFFGYLRRPTLATPVVSPSIVGLAALVCLAILIRLPFIVVARLADAAPQPPVFDLDLTDSFSKQMFFLNVMVVAPIIEELIFRLPLRPSPRNFAAPALLVCFYCFEPSLAALAGILLVPTLVYFVARWRASQVHGLFSRWFPALFYLSAFCFGVIHIREFDLSLRSVASNGCTVLQHTISGLLYGYVRMRRSVLASISCHALNNSNCFTVVASL